jgi:hypothetical protein
VLAPLRTFFDEDRVRVGRRTNDHRFDRRVIEHASGIVVGGQNAELGRAGLGGAPVDVGDGDEPGPRHAVGEVPRMQPPDAADAEHRDIDPRVSHARGPRS